MNGNRRRTKRDLGAADLLKSLMADRGWHPAQLEDASKRTGHPARIASRRTVYRVLNDGYVPSNPSQFEIAATFGLLPSHIWGSASLPSEFSYLMGERRMAA